MKSVIHSSLYEGGQGVGEASRVKDCLRKGIHKPRGVTPTLKILDERIAQCPFECYLRDDVLNKLVRHILDSIGCAQLTGLQHVYQSFLGSMRMFSPYSCVHEAIHLDGDHTLHHLVYWRAGGHVDLISRVIDHFGDRSGPRI